MSEKNRKCWRETCCIERGPVQSNRTRVHRRSGNTLAGVAQTRQLAMARNSVAGSDAIVSTYRPYRSCYSSAAVQPQDSAAAECAQSAANVRRGSLGARVSEAAAVCRNPTITFARALSGLWRRSCDLGLTSWPIRRAHGALRCDRRQFARRKPRHEFTSIPVKCSRQAVLLAL